MRVVLVGWGAIGQTVAELLQGGEAQIVAVAVRDAAVERPDLPTGAALITDPSDLAGVNPDLVAEAAGRASVGPWGGAALDLGADFVVSSVSAFADNDLLEDLRRRASATGTQIRIQPGALAGIDALSAARLLGIDRVEHRIVKPPRAWAGTPAEAMCSLDTITEAHEFFTADAAETAARFPKNANVAMTTALAGIGPSATEITLVADPAATTNRHQIRAHGAFGDLQLEISNSPLAKNPKSSAMAALSLARCIRNQTDTLVI